MLQTTHIFILLPAIPLCFWV